MPTQTEIFVNKINAYAKKQGKSKIMTKKDVLAIAELSKSSINPSDFCYNWSNKGLININRPFLLEYKGYDKFIILGENYPYTGKIYCNPNGGSCSVLDANWKKGKLMNKQINVLEVDKAFKKWKKYSKGKYWEATNSVLYDMVKNHPSHNDKHWIVAKMNIIGRSYSAQIERGVKNLRYYEDVVPKVKKQSLDNKINNLNNLSNNNILEMCKLHGYLTNIFNKISNKDNRSLASKYLHFHCPTKVYIYDSIVSKNIKQLVSWNNVLTREKKEIMDALKTHYFDNEYVLFAVKVKYLHDYINNTYNIDLTPRQLDDLLFHCI